MSVLKKLKYKPCGTITFSWSQRSWIPSMHCQGEILLLQSSSLSCRSLTFRYSLASFPWYTMLLCFKRAWIDQSFVEWIVWEWMSELFYSSYCLISPEVPVRQPCFFVSLYFPHHKLQHGRVGVYFLGPIAGWVMWVKWGGEDRVTYCFSKSSHLLMQFVVSDQC